jgi:hypothetical protein
MEIKCNKCNKIGILPTNYLSKNKKYIARYNRFGGLCNACSTMQDDISGRTVNIPNN